MTQPLGTSTEIQVLDSHCHIQMPRRGKFIFEELLASFLERFESACG